MACKSTSHQERIYTLAGKDGCEQLSLFNTGFELPSTAFDDTRECCDPYCLVGFPRARFSKYDLPGCTGNTGTDYITNVSINSFVTTNHVPLNDQSL